MSPRTRLALPIAASKSRSIVSNPNVAIKTFGRYDTLQNLNEGYIFKMSFTHLSFFRVMSGKLKPDY